MSIIVRKVIKGKREEDEGRRMKYLIYSQLCSGLDNEVCRFI